MINKKYYSSESGKVKKYKYSKTSDFDGGVTIFIRKRLFGFLWWILIRDTNRNPISFNHINHAQAFMNGTIKYDYVIDSEHKFVGNETIEIVHAMTDERAKNKIIKSIQEETGETIDPDCARAAWQLDGKLYIYRAINYAKLWNYIYKSNGKKLWTKLLVD